MIWDGISSFGGFFGAIAGAIAWTRRRKLPGLAFADDDDRSELEDPKRAERFYAIGREGLA